MPALLPDAGVRLIAANLPANDLAPTIALRQLCFSFPNGQPCFDQLNLSFAPEKTAIVGANGVGKSLLLKLMLGLLPADSGQILRRASVAYVPQQLQPTAHSRVVDIVGLGALWDALARIEAGSVDVADYAWLEGRWDSPARLAQALAEQDLGHLTPLTLAAKLSGGELTRLALLGAGLSGAQYLVLDEPSNHLDQRAKQRLQQHIAAWPGGVIMVSHDRQLLAGVERIVDITPKGIQQYGGNYQHYQQQQALQAQAQQAALQHAQQQRKLVLKQQQQQHDAQQQQAARQQRQAKHRNQAAILLGRNKARAEASSGRAKQQAAQQCAALDQAVKLAAQSVLPIAERAFMLSANAVPSAKRVLCLEDVQLPYLASHPALSFSLSGPFKLAIRGPNGCGKSTLLRVLASQLAPAQGRYHCGVHCAYLAQQTSTLAAEQSLWQQLQQANTPLSAAQLRNQLVYLGLDAEKIQLPRAQLSGGEQLKATLAYALWGEQPAQCLLLDEPSNHLDLPSQQALAQALQQYPGALVLVSHDEDLLQAIAPTHWLAWCERGWVLREA